jgi:hypothetical protein
LKDPYFFPFSSRAFPFSFDQPGGRLLEPVASALKLEQMTGSLLGFDA